MRAFALVASLVVALAARVIAHAGIPDVDTDAYGHFVVARRMLDAPTDLSVHWVWLPGWHVVHALFDVTGLGFGAVRVFSLGCSLATVALLFWWVERESLAACDRGRTSDRSEARERAANDAAMAASTAALALAVARPAIDAAGSAEPEALFSLLLLGSIVALRERRAVVAGMLAAAAALTRYEAWPFVAALVLIERLDAHGTPLRSRRAFAWALPLIAIGAWCVLHGAQRGEWLVFIQENRAFVARSLPRLHATLPPWPRRALQYPLILPWAAWGAFPLVLVALGLWQSARRRRWAIVIPPAVLVGFLTYSWLRAQHLGLVRHAVAYMPFYAAAMGIGAMWVSSRFGERARQVLVVALGLILCARGLDRALAHRRGSERALAHERRAAEMIGREARANSQIFCDVASVEALSGLHRSRFIRWNGQDIRPYNLSVAATRTDVWVVSRPERVRALRDATATRYESSGLVVLRVTR